jgi:thiopurine S-methyltransferase
VQIADGAPQLLICFEYDQNVVGGPPFSIDGDQVRRQYESAYSLTLLETSSLAGGLRGRYPASEAVWLLK